MIPLALESAWAVAGGLIPIAGLVAIAMIIWRAVRDNPSDDEDHRPEDPGE